VTGSVQHAEAITLQQDTVALDVKQTELLGVVEAPAMEVTMAEGERTEEEERTEVEGMEEVAMVAVAMEEEVEMAAILIMTEVVAVVEGLTEGHPGASHHSSQVTGTAKTVGLTILRGEPSVSSAEQAKNKRLCWRGRLLSFEVEDLIFYD